MVSTRLQRGETPQKTLHPGFVGTPGTQRRARKSTSPVLDGAFEDANLDESHDTRLKARENGGTANGKTSGHVNGHINGHANGHINEEAKGGRNGKIKAPGEEKGAHKTSKSKEKKQIIDGYVEGADVRIDQDPHYDFGGSWGVSAMMLLFPLLMWYMWIGATYYDGQLPLPTADESLQDFVTHLAQLVYDGAFPTAKAWLMYWTFFIFEAACYVLLPGVSALGKPLVHDHDRQLSYHCSGVWSFYVTIAVFAALHLSGLFAISTVLDDFGPLLSVSIASGFLVSLIAYLSAWWRGAQHRMTGYPIYDFFMGAELNPRMFGLLDFKMFFEVRIPWFVLLLLSCSAAARQWEQYGYVSGEVVFLIMAHFLYANACCKGEECIVTTWDIYYEKWGFMLIFWNLAGVPLSYCHCTLYLANHDPAEYRMPRALLASLFVAYLVVYWVWDTTNSQKNRFRQQERGGRIVVRKAWPQLPWQTLENPQVIKTETGDSILVDGWYGYARKIHYTCDLFFALSWGFVTGFASPFPWFYPVFFAAMITHRAVRDIQRCQAKYGDAWTEYTRRVPYLFIPYVF